MSITVRYLLVAIAIVASGSRVAAQGQVPARAVVPSTCPQCETSARVALTDESALRAYLERLQTEIDALRRLLEGVEDPVAARALRGAIENSLLHKGHLESQARMQRVRVEARAQGGGPHTVIATQVRQPSGYVGVSVLSPAMITESARGSVTTRYGFPVVVAVEPGSPAQIAGLMAGDTVVAVNAIHGSRIETELPRMLNPGNRLTFHVRRADSTRAVQVNVASRPASYVLRMSPGAGEMRPTEYPPDSIRVIRRGQVSTQGMTGTIQSGVQPGGVALGGAIEGLLTSTPSGTPFLREAAAFAGMRVVMLDAARAAQFGVSEGVLVVEVAPNMPGARAGLRENDVIVRAGDTPVRSAIELHRLVSEAADRAVMLELVRNGARERVRLSW